MKIAYISGVKFGYDLLSHILKNGWDVSIVLSYSDNKRKLYSDSCSFDALTSTNKIKHVKVQNINDSENVELVKNIQPDLILVMGWSQLLKADLIKISRIGVIGSHPTELPKYRGRAPIPWTILKNLKESALTFLWIEEGIDNGDILDQRKFYINENDDATSIYEKITEIGKQMIIENLSLIKNGKIKKTKQDNSQFIEYWEKRTPEDGKIDWTKPGLEIHNLIRASTTPYPGAFTFLRGKKLKIWKSEYLTEPSNKPGKIIQVGRNGVKVATSNGTVLLKEVSMNDQKEKASNLFSIDDEGLILG